MAVQTGYQALTEITNGPFDLCCLDIHLPDINGLEIMKRIKAISPRTKIVMMTGGEVTSPMLNVIRKHSELLLSKPFDLFKVKELVKQILESGGAAPDETDLNRNYKAFEYWLMNDQRRHKRRPVGKPISYSPVSLEQEQEQEQTAEIIDISEGGMCLLTTYLLPQGVVLKICNNKTDCCTGTVRWSTRDGNDDQCRTGIQFVRPGRLSSPDCDGKDDGRSGRGKS